MNDVGFSGRTSEIRKTDRSSQAGAAHRYGRSAPNFTANVAGGDVNGFVARAKRAVAQVKLPLGSYVEFAGAAEEQALSRSDLLVNALIATVGSCCCSRS